MQTRDEASPMVERFRRYLRDRRLPVTRQRIAVAEVLLASADHPSVEALRHRLEAKGQHVGTATLYRTVDALVKSGLVLEHDFGEGFRRYEPVTEAAEHAHLVCRRCGGVVEFSNDRLERMLRMTADEHHFHYERHKVEIHGICANCRGRDLGTTTQENR
ncbi:MAG: Fur family transcriptional regulator [Gemmatimonadales bacterium]